MRLGELGAMLGLNGADEFITAVRALNRKIGIPEKVRELKAEDFDGITQGAMAEADGYPVPHVMTADEIHEVLARLV